MLIEQLRKEWRACAAWQPIHDAPDFNERGLVLGAGTVLCGITGEEPGPPGQNSDARLKALLAVAYGLPGAGKALGHIKAAAIRWSEGDATLARLHLALSGVGPLVPPLDAARRLFMADGLMRAGIGPDAIIEALEATSAFDGATLKYTADQPRVPAGSGRTSGQWTSDGGTGGDAPSVDARRPSPTPPAPAPAASTGAETPSTADSQADRTVSVDATTPVAQTAPTAASATDAAVDANAITDGADFGAGLDWLAGNAARAVTILKFFARIAGEVGPAELAGPFTALTVLFWPTSAGPTTDWVKVGGPHDLKYFWSPDETEIRISYKAADGQTRIQTGNLGPGDEFRDPQGRPIARLIKAVGVVVSLASLEGIDAFDQEPRSCPEPPTPDRNGPRDEDRDYEDFVKQYLNPESPTPRGMGYALPNPTNSTGFTYFDDCWRLNGAMVDAKNNYNGVIDRMGSKPYFTLGEKWAKQASDQINSAPDRDIIWFFNDISGANYARKTFAETDEGRGRIKTIYLPMKAHKR